MGIHIGSSYQTNTGYVASASTLRQAVQAYHAPHSHPISIYLAGQKIASLALNEFIKNIQLFDKYHHLVWQRYTLAKFSLTEAQQVIQDNPDVAWVRLEIGHTHWQPIEKTVVVKQDISSPRFILKQLFPH